MPILSTSKSPYKNFGPSNQNLESLNFEIKHPLEIKSAGLIDVDTWPHIEISDNS